MTTPTAPDRGDQYEQEANRRTRERRIRFDLCDRCDERRTSATHQPGYRMPTTPYLIPGHAFVPAGGV